MLDLFIKKVLSILGGLCNEDELENVKQCFYNHLSPERTSNVILNSRK